MPCTHAEGVERHKGGRGATYEKAFTKRSVLDELKLRNFLIQSGT